MRRLFLSFILFLLIIGTSCKKSTQPVNEELKGNIELQQSYSPGVTDSYLKLIVTEAEIPTNYEILRDEQLVLSGSLSKTDTLLVDTTLTPNTSYTYLAQLIAEGKIIDTSGTVTLTTMDTTSHNFTWEVYEFGTENYHTSLYDVSIINENDIWAVGEIHTEETDCYDSLGNWVQPFNAVHWNGDEWELLRIPFNEMCGGVLYPKIYSVFSIAVNDIWFTSGGSIVYYNGINFENDCSMNSLLDGSMRELWGFSSDIYAIGYLGTIVHYNGSIWQKLETNTEADLYDIWGRQDGSELYVCGFNLYSTPWTSVLLKVKDNTIITEYEDKGDLFAVYNDSLCGYYKSILGFSDSPFLLIGSRSGIYRYLPSGLLPVKRLTQQPDRLPGNPHLAGGELNDFYAFLGTGEFMHYNGLNWKQYNLSYSEYYGFNNTDHHANIICATGSIDYGPIYTKSFVLIGRAH